MGLKKIVALQIPNEALQQQSGVNLLFVWLLVVVLLPLIVLVIMWLVRNATERSQLLQLFSVTQWVEQLPFLRSYIQQAERIQNTTSTVTRYADSTRRAAAADFGLDQPQAQPATEAPPKEPWHKRIQFWRKREAATDSAETASETPTTAIQVRPEETTPPPAPYVPDPVAIQSVRRWTVQGQMEVLGRRFDRYQVLGLLASGHLSTVYKARDLKLGRDVALKVLRPELTRQEMWLERLLAQVRRNSRLYHTHVLEIYDFDVFDDIWFVVSELVGGPPIDQYIYHMRQRDERVVLDETLALISQVAEALAYAHQHGIVHGGLKPDHIRLQSQLAGNLRTHYGQNGDMPILAKVTDFGFSTLFDRPILLSPEVWPYMAPEQFRGQPPDNRSDVYALGLILYELTTGEQAFPVHSYEEAVEKHLTTTPTPPTNLRQGLPPEIVTVIEKAIAKDPADRFQSIQALSDKLEELAEVTYATLDRTAAVLLEGGTTYVYPFRVKVECVGEKTRLIQLHQGQSMLVGSAENCDVYLPSATVRPYHLRVIPTLTGWAAVDLGSDAGTNMAGSRLLVDLAEDWFPNQLINVGPYNLTLQQLDADGNVLDVDTIIDEVAPLDAYPTEIKDDEGTVVLTRLRLEPDTTLLAPGERADMQVTLTNLTTQVRHFEVHIDHLPPAWFTLSHDALQLLPSGQAFILLSLHPPAGSNSRAGVHTFTVRATMEGQVATYARLDGQLEVSSVENVQVSLTPELLRGSGRAVLKLDNMSNLPLDCTIRPIDGAGILQFEVSHRTVELEAGESAEVTLDVAPQKRPLFGTNQINLYEVHVTSGTGFTQTPIGQLQVRPRVPSWVLAIFGVLFALLCVLLGMQANGVIDRMQSARATANAVVSVEPTETREPTKVPTEAVTVMQTSCVNIKLADPEAEDGDYELFFSFDPPRSTTIYCHNMESSPAEYLTLINERPTDNIAVNSHPDGTITVQFEKIRLNPATLAVDLTDATFATVRRTYPEDQYAPDPYYGSVVVCTQPNDFIPTGIATINLRGTDFAIADDILPSTAWSPVKSEIEFSTLRRYLTLRNRPVNDDGGCTWLGVDLLRLAYRRR